MKRIFLLWLAIVSVMAASLQAANLKVQINPSAAASTGARWRVDGGAWQVSNATVKNLSNGNHQVEFKPVTNWITPSATTVALSAPAVIRSTILRSQATRHRPRNR